MRVRVRVRVHVPPVRRVCTHFHTHTRPLWACTSASFAASDSSRLIDILALPSFFFPSPPAYCGVDTSVNGMTILSLFIGLLLGTGLGIVVAQILPKKQGGGDGKQDAQFKTNPMRSN